MLFYWGWNVSCDTEEILVNSINPEDHRAIFPEQKMNSAQHFFFLLVNYPLSKRVASFHQCLLLIKSVVVAVIYESGITVDWCTRVAYNWVTLNR